MQAPPPLPTQYTPRRSWIERNLKWFIPLLCVFVVVGIGGFIVTIMSLMKSSDAYSGALARVKASPAVTNTIGLPIKDGFFFNGNISMNGSSGRANMNIPVSGPKGAATAYVSATKSLGEWHFDKLIVTVKGSNQRIDLSETNSP